MTQSGSASAEQQAVTTIYPILRPVMAWWRQHLVWEATPAGEAARER